MTTTLNEDGDRCYVCHRQPATTYGMCSDCFQRSVWFLDPPPWSDR